MKHLMHMALSIVPSSLRCRYGTVMSTITTAEILMAHAGSVANGFTTVTEP